MEISDKVDDRLKNRVRALMFEAKVLENVLNERKMMLNEIGQGIIRANTANPGKYYLDISPDGAKYYLKLNPNELILSPSGNPVSLDPKAN